MKFLFDECVSPTIARHLGQTHGFDAAPLRDRGMLQASDRAVFELARREDRVLVTENVDDFRAVAIRTDVHPGLMFLPSVRRDEARRLMDLVVAHLLRHGGERPHDVLVNRARRISANGDIRVEPLSRRT